MMPSSADCLSTYSGFPTMSPAHTQAVHMPAMGFDCQSYQPLEMQSPQLQLPQMQGTQMELPAACMSQMHVSTPLSGASTPSEIDRCMAIIMPQASQFPQDMDLV